jgi:hypothetical protein
MNADGDEALTVVAQQAAAVRAVIKGHNGIMGKIED